MSLAQSPDELFDIVNAGGTPTGVVKRRGDVHRDGDWHRAIHVWVISERADGPTILCQQRSFAKDTWPGEFDVTVGGHLGSGEGLEDAYREVEEEIGIAVDPEQLVWIGRRIAINDEPGNYLDRELQDVFLLRDDRPLANYVPNRDELEGLIEVPLDHLLDLLSGDRESIVAARRPSTSDKIEPVILTLKSFRLTHDRYFYRVVIAARNHLRGDRHVAV
ncbi:MAG: NUDIX domain-containing protein [Thermomicrobiales bacterium]